MNHNISSYYDPIYKALLEFFPDGVSHLIVLFIKMAEFEAAREEHKIDCNYFRIQDRLGGLIPNLKDVKIIKSYNYFHYYSGLMKDNCILNEYWKHVDKRQENKSLLNELKRVIPKNISNYDSEEFPISSKILYNITNMSKWMYVLMYHYDNRHEDLGYYNPFTRRLSGYTEKYINPNRLRRELNNSKNNIEWIEWHRLKENHKQFVQKFSVSNKRTRFKKNDKYLFRKKHFKKFNPNKRRKNYGPAQHWNRSKSR